MGRPCSTATFLDAPLGVSGANASLSGGRGGSLRGRVRFSEIVKNLQRVMPAGSSHQGGVGVFGARGQHRPGWHRGIGCPRATRTRVASGRLVPARNADHGGLGGVVPAGNTDPGGSSQAAVSGVDRIWLRLSAPRPWFATPRWGRCEADRDSGNKTHSRANRAHGLAKTSVAEAIALSATAASSSTGSKQLERAAGNCATDARSYSSSARAPPTYRSARKMRANA